MPQTPLKLSDFHKHILIRALFVLFIIVIGWVSSVQPILKKINARKGMTKDIYERSQMIQNIQQLKQKNKDFDKLLSAQEDQHTLLGKISKLASDNGLDVQSLVPLTESAGQYQRISFRLTAKATYASAVRFLKTFEELPIFGAVSRFSMANRAGRGTILSTPDIDMLLETYLKKKE